MLKSFFSIGQIVRNWKWNHRVRKLFTVNGITDLNLNPACRQPGENKDYKELGMLWWKSGPISAVIHTNRFDKFCFSA